jgi:hypothetical protein
MKAAINSDESEESLLTAKDAWQDYQSLEIALAEEGTGSTAQQWLELPPGVWALVRELVADGVCQDEREVITRAVEAFFVAVSPQHARRHQVLRDARAKYE